MDCLADQGVPWFAMPPKIDVTLFGPVAATVGGDVVRLGGPKQTALFALLALTPGKVVSSERIIDGLWGEEPPETAAATVQVFVSKLRKALGAATPGGEAVIVTRSPGYVLDDAAVATDVDAFRRQITEARNQKELGNLTKVDGLLREVRKLGASEPLADVEFEPFAGAAIARLREEYLNAVEDHLDVLLQLGRHHECVAELESLTAEHPLRERLWAMHALALYRSERQADALDRIKRARDLLVEELGVDPGPELRRLEAEILNQSEGLLLIGAAPAQSAEDLAPTVQAEKPPVARLALPDGQVLVVEPPAVIGRQRDCQIVVSDASVSRRHAELRTSFGKWLAIDLGSTNGTKVNGDPERERELAHGDRLTVGNVELVFLLDVS